MMKKYKRDIIDIGNSKGVIIPSEFIKEQKLQTGDIIEITFITQGKKK